MKEFKEYLEQNSSIKKKMINESYEVKSYDGQEDVSYDYLTLNDDEINKRELENIAEFLNLIKKRNEKLSEWKNLLKKNPRLDLLQIKIKCGIK